MPDRKKISVLTIEDERIIRQGIADYLEDCEFTVYQAENGRRGMEIFQQHHPDVVLTDLRMPIMGGREVIASLSEKSPETPVIVVSGVGDIRDAIDAIHLGAWDYIIKPIQDMAILLHAIDKAMERAYLIKENREYRETLENAREIADRDMRMAINVQKSYLPKTPPSADGWDIAFDYRAMAGVSGDFYDFYEKDGKLSGLSLFDVSGHGIASGLITMLAKSIVFRAFNAFQSEEINTLMERINRDLINEIDNVDNYLTGIIIRIYNGSVEYVNAAHPHMLLRRGLTGRVEIIGAGDEFINGRFLGISSLEGRYDMCRVKVEKDDVLLLYTDCLIETYNGQNERYGVQRLIEQLEGADIHESSQKILQGILDNYFTFTGSESLPDDVTVILLKKTL